MRIGITGYAGSGKDVVADVLVETFGFRKVNMSDALDRYLQILNPIIQIEFVTDGDYFPRIAPVRYADLRATTDLTEAKKIPEVRQLLQRLGTDVGRAIDPEMWVNELNKEADKHRHVVTTGIRFIEEVDPLDVLIHVDRIGFGPVNDHPSEMLDDIFVQSHYTLQNAGTIEDLQQLTIATLREEGLVPIGEEPPLSPFQQMLANVVKSILNVPAKMDDAAMDPRETTYGSDTRGTGPRPNHLMGGPINDPLRRGHGAPYFRMDTRDR
jgi:hypothetical protein